MNAMEKQSRRNFIKTSAAWTSGSLVLCYANDLLFPSILKAAGAQKATGTFKPNIFIEVMSSGKVNLVCHRSEMGQGARTSMIMLLAEELEVAWTDINVIQGGANASYGDQNTDGSTSVRLNYEALRNAGATARSMLIAAAAKKWNIDASQCYAKESRVMENGGSKRSLGYGELASDAAKIPVPKDVVLKTPKDFTIVGTEKTLLDAADIVQGRANYGIDAQVPKMLVASLERSPTIYGKPKSFDAQAALKVKGVLKVVALPALPQTVNTSHSVAVLAKDHWAALKGREKLNVVWDAGKKNLETSDQYLNDLEKALTKAGTSMRKEGNIDAGKKTAKIHLQKKFHTPYLAHATMEPLACAAHVGRGSCEVWAPTQDPQRLQKAIADFLKIPAARVKVNITLLGGGFGRKSQPDFVLEAVALSQKVKQPVKVIWKREDEIKHGFYHAEAMQTIEAGLDKDNRIAYWRHKTAFPTIQKVFDSRALLQADWELAQGCTQMPYESANIDCAACAIPSDLRIGWLRSVCHIFHAFAVNSTMDELATLANEDVIDFRLQNLRKQQTFPYSAERMARVIQEARKFSNWKRRSLPKGHGLGFANHYSFFSYVAMVVEASLQKDNRIKVQQVDCVVDCGVVVNPDTVRAQIEGAVVFALSAALYSKITVKNGVVEQSNFDDYVLARIEDTPKINIQLISSQEPPTGIGEPGVPPVAPALCGAIYAVTGKRLVNLPLI